MAKLKILSILITITGIFCFGAFSFVLASSTDGTIDSTYKYAWGENIGWLNFGTSNGDVHITDSGLSGYALGENIGWVYLGDVANDGEGNLSGYAWGENVGWIKFNPTNGGVVINSSGEFTGSALGENIGWIIFGGDYKVKTDWRPQSARVCTSWTYSDWSSCSNSQQTRTVVSSSPSGCSGGSPTLTQSCSSPAAGGGGLPVDAYKIPSAPQGGFKVIINDNQGTASDRKVRLILTAGSDTARMVLSNDSSFSASTGQIPYQSSYEWDLCQNKTECPEATYTVYVKFFTQYGVSSETVSANIVLGEAKTIREKITEIPGKIIEKIKEVPEKIKEIFVPKPKPTPTPLPIEEIVPKETPLVFQGIWVLLPRKAIDIFAFSPLPKEIQKLSEKFPELAETLKKVGITKMADLEKLETIKLKLPGLTESVGLPVVKVEPGKFALPFGIPLAELTSEAKQKIPTEIVFAKTGAELIDFNIGLNITEKGEPEQRIFTISGKPLQLAVKPANPVKKIKGYVVFKSKKSSDLNSPTASTYNLRDLMGSLIFALPSFAKEYVPTEIETKLVLQEFEYTDLDGDGIYTAEINAPLAEGEYEIITVMDYENINLGSKEIRLITVVDPEGYVYSQLAQGKLRIIGAVVSLYWLNSQTKQYQLWPAKEYQQENPQITDDTGKYSFLVPEGFYYLRAEAPNYPSYQSDPFQVKEGSGIHENILLKKQGWWLGFIDWKIIVLVIFGAFLLYNFYRDKIRTIKRPRVSKP